jgi:hypothetical protein
MSSCLRRFVNLVIMFSNICHSLHLRIQFSRTILSKSVNLMVTKRLKRVWGKGGFQWGKEIDTFNP